MKFNSYEWIYSSNINFGDNSFFIKTCLFFFFVVRISNKTKLDGSVFSINLSILENKIWMHSILNKDVTKLIFSSRLTDYEHFFLFLLFFNEHTNTYKYIQRLPVIAMCYRYCVVIVLSFSIECLSMATHSKDAMHVNVVYTYSKHNRMAMRNVKVWKHSAVFYSVSLITLSRINQQTVVSFSFREFIRFQ